MMFIISQPTLIIASVVVYSMCTYAAAVAPCRRGLSRVPVFIAGVDRVAFTVLWLIAPVWVPFFLLHMAVFAGVTHKNNAQP